jgi:CheY-like chemotaxis protein/HPt (histidine-containing phosphotransfer) domain-containing protein
VKLNKIDSQISNNLPSVKAYKFTEQFAARVLVVDDNQINRIVAKDMLKIFGLTVDLAKNGEAALNILENNHYDLIFMDCQMPVMDGYTATRKIRDLKSHVREHNIPIIAMTANAMQGDEDKCIESGMSDYLAKPFDLSTLLERLNCWLKDFKITGETNDAQINNFDKSSDDTKLNTSNLTSANEKPLAKTSHPLFDYNAIHERLAGNLEMIHSITHKFISSIEGYINTINQASQKTDLEIILSTSHTLKGSSATIGCMQLSYIASEIEKACKEKNMKKVEDFIPQLQPCYLETLKAVNIKLQLI